MSGGGQRRASPIFPFRDAYVATSLRSAFPDRPSRQTGIKENSLGISDASATNFPSS